MKWLHVAVGACIAVSLAMTVVWAIGLGLILKWWVSTIA